MLRANTAGELIASSLRSIQLSEDVSEGVWVVRREETAGGERAKSQRETLTERHLNNGGRVKEEGGP